MIAGEAVVAWSRVVVQVVAVRSETRPADGAVGVGQPVSTVSVVGNDSGLHGVLFLLARDERTASATAGWGPVSPDLGGVQAELDALGLGEYVRQCLQT